MPFYLFTFSFCSNFERFIEPEFVPSEEDMIMARVMTVGIIKTDFNYPPLQITLVDGMISFLN